MHILGILIVSNCSHIDHISRAIKTSLRNRLLEIIGSKVVLNSNILGIGRLVGVGAQVHYDIVVILIILRCIVGHVTLIVCKVIVTNGREGYNSAQSHLREGVVLLCAMVGIQEDTNYNHAYTKNNELMSLIHLFI